MITQRQLEGIASEFATQKEKWLEFWISKLVPPVCVRWVKERKNLSEVSDYLMRRKIILTRNPGSNVEILYCNGKPVASLELKFTR